MAVQAYQAVCGLALTVVLYPTLCRHVSLSVCTGVAEDAGEGVQLLREEKQTRVSAGVREKERAQALLFFRYVEYGCFYRTTGAETSVSGQLPSSQTDGSGSINDMRENIVPDSCGDIARIVDTTGSVCLTGRELTSLAAITGYSL